MDAASVVECARTWIGTPYVPQAQVKGAGCDCAGFVVGVGKELGLIPPGFDPGAYREQDLGILYRHLEGVFEACDPVAGAVLCFRVGERCRHLGICTGAGVVHVYGRRYGVTEHTLTEHWLKRLESAWMWRRCG